jgi:endonuclease/exonuclease/phosphatase family metal-dependent hydrolase
MGKAPTTTRTKRKTLRSTGNGGAKSTAGNTLQPVAKANSSKGKKRVKRKPRLQTLGQPQDPVIKKVSAKPAGTIRVLSWNIQGTYEDGSKLSNVGYKRTAKVKTIAKVVQNAQPDVMVIQEAAGGKSTIFDTELENALPAGYKVSSGYDQPNEKGQRYLAIHKTTTTLTFSGFDDFGRTSLTGRLQPFDEDIALRSRKPATIEVDTGSARFTAATWHAPHGGELAARSANQQYSAHLGATRTKPDVFVGDLNIQSAEARGTYGLRASSMSSNNFDHVISMTGRSVTSVNGLPNQQNLKKQFGLQVSDHSMVGGDIRL